MVDDPVLNTSLLSSTRLERRRPRRNPKTRKLPEPLRAGLPLRYRGLLSLDVDLQRPSASLARPRAAFPRFLRRRYVVTHRTCDGTPTPPAGLGRQRKLRRLPSATAAKSACSHRVAQQHAYCRNGTVLHTGNACDSRIRDDADAQSTVRAAPPHRSSTAASRYRLSLSLRLLVPLLPAAASWTLDPGAGPAEVSMGRLSPS